MKQKSLRPLIMFPHFWSNFFEFLHCTEIPLVAPEIFELNPKMLLPGTVAFGLHGENEMQMPSIISASYSTFFECPLTILFAFLILKRMNKFCQAMLMETFFHELPESIVFEDLPKVS